MGLAAVPVQVRAALAVVARLVAGGVGYESKLRREVVYRGQVADAFEPDIVFPRQLIVELKSLRTEFLPDHFTQLLAYQKFWAIGTGLLFDFGKASLIFKRVVFTSVVAEFPVVLVPAWAEPSGLATALVELLGQVQRDHGLGYRETTWRGLVVAALKADGVGHLLAPAVKLGEDSQQFLMLLTRLVCKPSSMAKSPLLQLSISYR